MALKTPWKDWVDDVVKSVSAVPDVDLERAAMEILCADVVLTAGNGGSASLASHMAQAIAKPNYGPEGGRAAICLTDHTPTLTAHANDGGWPDALASSAYPFLGPRCTAVVFSSSGKSENVVRLARIAVAKKGRLVVFTGFEGEPLKSLAHVSLHVPSNDYEVVEPVHDALLHRVQYHLRNMVGSR